MSPFHTHPSRPAALAGALLFASLAFSGCEQKPAAVVASTPAPAARTPPPTAAAPTPVAPVLSPLVDKMLTKALASQDSETRTTLFDLSAEAAGTEVGLAAAIPLAQRIPDDNSERSVFLATATTAAAQANLDATLATLLANPKLLATDEVTAAIGPALAQARGVPFALTWIQANVPAASRSAAFSPVAVAWAATKPADAADWARGLSDTSVLAEVVNAWGDQDLPATIHWLKAHITPQVQETLMPTAFASWTDKKPLDASKLALTELDGEVAHSVLPALATAIGADAQADPAAWYASLPPDDQTSDLRQALALGWLPRDSAAAIAWLQQATPPVALADAWNQAVKQWAQNDAASLDKWLQQAPAGALRDAAIKAYARELAFSDAAGAKTAAAQLADPAERDALDKEIDETADAIKKQIAAGGTPGLVFLDDNGKPLPGLPKDLSIQVQTSDGNATTPPAKP